MTNKMTQKQFNRYSTTHGVKNVDVVSEYEMLVTFGNGKIVSVNNGSDGFYFIKTWVKIKEGASKNLLTELQLISPKYYRSFIEKYGEKSQTIETRTCKHVQ